MNWMNKLAVSFQPAVALFTRAGCGAAERNASSQKGVVPKIADQQAHNASIREAMRSCISATAVAGLNQSERTAS